MKKTTSEVIVGDSKYLSGIKNSSVELVVTSPPYPMIAMWDERLSTSGAFNISSNLDIKFPHRKKNIDEKAAAFILQGAIDFLNN